MEGLERLLATVARQAPHFVGVADAALRPIFVNEAGRRMVGLAPDGDLSGLSIPAFFVAEERAFFRDIVLPALLEAGAWEGEARFGRFDGGSGAR